MAKADYYQILQVSRDADEKTIKNAYRKLAMQYHPDRNPGDTVAETKFKEASEAYEVLSNKDKRSIYDRYGHDGLKGGPSFHDVQDIFGNFGDIFSEFFGGGFSSPGGSRRGGGQRSRARRGNDLQYTLVLTLKEAALGVKKQIEVPQFDSCGTCQGSGHKPGSEQKTCKTCKGQGQVVQGQGMFLISTTCPECRGEGIDYGASCVDCQGRGYQQRKTNIQVDVPAGFDDGMSLRYTGKGEAGFASGPAGDLYVLVKVEEDETFKRQEDRLIVEVEIPMVYAALGSVVRVPTLEGEEDVDIPSGSQPYDQIVLKKQGVPHLRGQGRGDLIVVLKVQIPQDLNAEQRSLLEQLAKTMNLENPPPPTTKKSKKKGFFNF